MDTDLNKTGKRKRIYTKHKITTSETDQILLPEKGTHKKMRRTNNDSPSLPPKYNSKKSTLLSSKKTHPSNINDIKISSISQANDPVVQNVIAVPESPAKVFTKVNSF